MSAYRDYEKKVANMTMRERVMVLMVGICAFVTPIYFYVIDANNMAEKKINSSMSSLKTDLDEKRSELETWQSRITKDPNLELREELQNLNKEIADISGKLDKGATSLVDASHMSDILKGMLKTSEIELLSMENLPPKILMSNGDSLLYQHTVRMTFKGRYLDIMKHMEKMENSGYNFNWHLINYHVVQYPVSEVTVEVYTLSINKDFLHA
ncbi:MAG: hypothetical protein II847_00945 [Ruminobacter sp.]|jgi:MSHA biogenesis protein MshJ|uniref:MSHA biogenesis protein MshJ n=1 Tax=Ruminobacter amylophilus TaxID=867 RepID=A0A662ZKP8_9GAMM|nr:MULTISPECIES: hypothetical protein [Ruminobacter]MBQ3774679.1 hypothetical protein [Ruminobacter sp.]SFP65371.1 hypothetical protein SAMN02910344_01977 [Ruminobacter amylophilus]